MCEQSELGDILSFDVYNLHKTSFLFLVGAVFVKDFGRLVRNAVA